MLRRLSVRGKILAALAVPVLVLFVAATLIAGQSISQARVASLTHSLVDALPAQDNAIDALQAERAASDDSVRKDTGAAYTLTESRDTTDDALTKRDEALKSINSSAVSSQVKTAIQGALTASTAVEQLRRQVDANGATTDYLDEGYETIIAKTFEVQQTLADAVTDRGLARYVDAYNTVDQLVSETSVETTSGKNLLIDAQGLGDSIRAAQNSGVLGRAVSMASLVASDDQLRTSANTAMADLGIKAELPAPTGDYLVTRGALAAADPSAASSKTVTQWPVLSDSQLANYSAVRDQVRAATAAAATRAQNSATERALVTIGIALLALVLTVVIALAIARQIVRPLRRLTDAAANVREELPNLVDQVAEPGRGPDLSLEEIPVESSDEVGQLARAFNDVNATTIEVAKQQAALRGSIAEMFVNVARRDQVLLNRQLSFLDDLERSEEDPNALSNLFRLDHLATRMRRNAESLLVLAGIDSGRRVRQPMPTSDVIRTASSEIEMYDRVRLILPVDPQMLGHNALSSAHLLAEILENATRFSEPHTQVEVSTNRTSDGVQVLVRDYGLGMGPDELAEAIARVTTSDASDVIGAQRLGLYVVGRLAGRLHAQVQFMSSGVRGEGTTAVVTFPTALFMNDSSLPLPEPTDPLTASTQAAANQLTRGPSAASAGALSQADTQSPARTSLPVEDEPEVVRAVDLEALTDGTTSTGMPRRRAAQPEPAATGSGPATAASSVVLPPIETPDLPSMNLTGDDGAGWVPPEMSALPMGSSLPSRSRGASGPAALPQEPPLLALGPSAAAPHDLPDDTAVDLVPVSDDVVASAMFRGFRPMTDLQRVLTDDEHPVDPGADRAVMAADDVPGIPVAQHEDRSGGFAPPTPNAAPASDVESEALPAVVSAPEWPSAPDLPEPSLASHEVADEATDWAPQFELGEPGLPSRTEQADAVESSPPAAIWEPAPENAPSAPYSDLGGYFGGPAEDDADVKPAPEHVDPALQPIAADAESAQPGEQMPVAQQDQGAPQHEDPFAQTLPPFDELLTNLPTRRDVREAARRNRGWFRRGYSQQAYTDALATLSRPTPVVPISAITSPESLGLDGPRPDTGGIRQAGATVQPAASAPYEADPAQDYAPRPVEVQRWNEVDSSSQMPQRQSAYRPASTSAAAPAPAPVQAPAELQAPADLQAPVSSPRVPNAATDDDGEDSLMAQSEWLASEVLYKEMTSLLRTSPDFNGGSAPTGAGYQPMVDLTTGPSLTRRARREQALTGELHIADGVDRDAEVLRERLRAFQSGTRRAREDARSQTSVDLDAEFEAAFGRPTNSAEGTGAAGEGHRNQY